MSEMLVITIPIVPPRELSPNASWQLHWSVKSQARRDLHCAAFMAAKNSIRSYERNYGPYHAPEGIVDVLVTIGWGKGRRVMDGDNALASLKSAFDGLAQAGIVENDKQFRFHPVEQIRDKSGAGYVDVRIESGGQR